MQYHGLFKQGDPLCGMVANPHPCWPLAQSQLYHFKNHPIWADMSLMALLELSLAFKCLWPPLMWSSPPAWLCGEPSDLIGLNSDSPPLPSCRFSPWDSFLDGEYLFCIVHLLYMFTFCIKFFFPMIHSAIIWIFMFDCFNNWLLPIIVTLFNYRSIFVCYFDPGHVI